MLANTFIAVFLVSVVLAGYVYGYPGVLAALAAVLRDKKPRRTATRPQVTLIVAAYNEEEVIAEKIENCLALDYPDEKLDIVVFSDASTDRTDEIVRSYADDGVELRRIEGRVGKTECQNRVAATAEGDILVFTDANAMFDPDAIEMLVSRFTDDVGCVVGELRHTCAADDVTGESLYWRYMRLIKRLESRLTSVVKGNGAIYAVRSDAYVPLDPEEISDFAEPLAVKADGWAVTYESEAVARERTAGSVDAERSRKVRIATRGWHALPRYLSLANPLRYGFYAVQFLTNTLLWWSSPLYLMAAVVSAVGLAVLGVAPFGLVVSASAIMLVLAAGGFVLDERRKTGTAPTLLHVPHYFLMGNYSLLIGFWNFLRGENIVTWETDR